MGDTTSTWSETGTRLSRMIDGEGRRSLTLVAVGVPLAVVVLAVVASAEPAAGLRALFACLCHQQPDRCLAIGPEPMALCARCTGLYFGLALGHGLFGWLNLREAAAVRFLCLAGMIALSDWALGWVAGWQSGPWFRGVTGLGAGIGCAWFTRRGLEQLWSGSSRGGRVHERR